MTEGWETRVPYKNIHKWLIIWQNTLEWFLYYISNFLARLSARQRTLGNSKQKYDWHGCCITHRTSVQKGASRHAALSPLAVANGLVRCWPPANTWFLGSVWVGPSNGISIGSAVFAQLIRIPKTHTTQTTLRATCHMRPNNMIICLPAHRPTSELTQLTERQLVYHWILKSCKRTNPGVTAFQDAVNYSSHLTQPLSSSSSSSSAAGQVNIRASKMTANVRHQHTEDICNCKPPHL